MLLAWAAAGTAQAAGWSIPTGARLDVAGGSLDLAAGNIEVAGALALGSGQLRGVGDVAIAAGGSVDAGSGSVEVREHWRNLGAFVAGSSSVHFVDGLALVNDVLGSNRFHNVSFVSARGETYRFQSGVEQQVAGALQIQGQGAPILFASTSAGSAALLNLLPGGTQAISNVGVDDVAASGQALAPTDSNQTAGGSANGWFGGGGALFARPEVIPATGSPALLLLSALVALIAMRLFRRPLPSRQD